MSENTAPETGEIPAGVAGRLRGVGYCSMTGGTNGAFATAGIGLKTIASEYDAPQFEFTIEHKPPLEAIDNTWVTWLVRRAHGRRRGWGSAACSR